MLTHLFNLISPVGQLPRPTGPYQNIASEVVMWNPTRLLQVKLTYPCKLEGQNYRPGKYMQKRNYKPLSKTLNLPRFTIKHYMTVGVNSVRRLKGENFLPLVDNIEKFPVAIFSHGWSGKCFILVTV
jgi:hypothetical protein